MAAANSVLRSQLNIKSVSSSVSSLSKGVDRAQKSASRIGQTLIKRNKFKKDAIAQDKLSFFKRREAVRRREQEGVIEAGQLSGSAKRTAVPMGAAIAESTKGFLSRMMDFVGNIFVGWLLGNLPTIINTAKNLITRIQTLSGILGRFVADIGSIIFAFGDTLGAISSNVLGFDFGKEDRDVKTEFDKLNDAVSQLGTHFDEAINLLKTPLGQGPGEQEKPEPPPAESTGQEAQPSAPPAPSGTIKPSGQTTQSQNLQKGDKVSGFSVTSGYGPRWGGTHKGVDVGTPVGTYVALSVPTEIVFAGLHGTPGRGYGNVVDAWAPSLGIQFRMAHLNKIKVKAGSKIGAGEVIGQTGGAQGDRGSGSSTGPHVHFEVDNRKGGTDYGGMGNPSSFAKFLSLSSKEPTKQQTQSQPQTPAVPSGGRTPSAPSAPSGSSGGGKWKPILDLISQAESAGGSYDSRYGGIYPGYSKLTIAEADRVQRENYRRWGSAASGRYQFMNIASQAAAAGLKPTDLFSPANQDKMAIALIEKKRKVTLDMIKNNPRDAQQRLAQEWAGIPIPGAERSYYPPPNKATVTNAQVKKAFSAMGAPQQAQVAAQPSTPPAAEVSGPLTKEQALSIAGISQPDLNATGQMQALTPERTGTNVVVTPQQAAPQAAPQQQGSSGPRMTTSEISPEIVLNRFMATRLLLDLAYT